MNHAPILVTPFWLAMASWQLVSMVSVLRPLRRFSAVVGILPVVLVDGAPGVVQVGALGRLLLLAVAAVALRRPKVEVEP